MIRILKYVGAATIGLTLVVLAFALPYRWYLQHQTAEGRAIRSAEGIDSLVSVRIGGIDQWIHVRGQNVNNPILLFIHGGPGIAFIALAGSFQGPWESRFTVVQWDQRGAGNLRHERSGPSAENDDCFTNETGRAGGGELPEDAIQAGADQCSGAILGKRPGPVACA